MIVSSSSQKERNNKGFFFKHLWDFILLGSLLIGTTAIYVGRAISSKQENSTDIVATVLYEGNKMEIPGKDGKNMNPFSLANINEYQEIEIEGRHTTLVIGLKHNAIAIVSSGCPGQECVHEGWISKANHPIVCAHNGIYIEISIDDWGEITQG